MFVRQLLVLNEERRMTTREALAHPWFNNDCHKTDFEELYQRAIRHWRPRVPKHPIIDIVEASSLKNMLSLVSNQDRTRKRGPSPIDPPYCLFPRRLSSSFFPRRRNVSMTTLPEDVELAIKENWTTDSRKALPSGARDCLLRPQSTSASSGGVNGCTPIRKLRSRPTSQAQSPSTAAAQVPLPSSPRFHSLGHTQPKDSSHRIRARAACSIAGNDLIQCTSLESGPSPNSDTDDSRDVHSCRAWSKASPADESVMYEKDQPVHPTQPIAPRPDTEACETSNNSVLIQGSSANSPRGDAPRPMSDHLASKGVTNANEPIGQPLGIDAEAVDTTVHGQPKVGWGSACTANTNLQLKIPVARSVLHSKSTRKKRRRCSIFDFEEDEDAEDYQTALKTKSGQNIREALA